MSGAIEQARKSAGPDWGVFEPSQENLQAEQMDLIMSMIEL